jgi:hypothetical protein
VIEAGGRVGSFDRADPHQVEVGVGQRLRSVRIFASVNRLKKFNIRYFLIGSKKRDKKSQAARIFFIESTQITR